MKTIMGLVLLVGAVMLVPGYTFAAENCSTTTMSAGEQIKQAALESDQRSSVSF